MKVLINQRCIISFECSNKFEMVYEGNKIIIRETKPVKETKPFPSDVVPYDIKLQDGDIYDKIVQLCEVRHMSVRQLACMIDMPYTTLLSKIKRHQKKVSEAFIDAVAIALDVEPNKLKEV